MHILITGGNGLLGKHLIPLIKIEDGDGTMYPRVTCDAPTHKELDITKPIKLSKKYDLIIHCAAFTDLLGAEENPEECYEVNYWGTKNLAEATRGTPFVYISSTYVDNPVNNYSLSKLAGEIILNDPHLTIRTLFKPRPFEYDRALVDQQTIGDYIDVIAPLIWDRILNWDKQISRQIYVGTKKKSIFELAKQTRPDVKPIYLKDIKGVKLPKEA